MKLAARQINEFLASPANVAGVLIYGPDSGQTSRRAAQIAAKVLSGGEDGFNRTELSQEQMTADEAILADELNAMSLMGGRRLIVLRDMDDKVASIIKQALGQCSSSIKPQDQHYLLVTAGELGPRSVLRALFEKEQSLAALPCYKEEAQSIAQLIRNKFDAAGLRYPSEAIAYLSRQLAGDRMVIESELNKILLYYQGDSQIEIESLQQLVASSMEIEMDALCHAFAGGQLPLLMRHLDSALLSGVQPIVILRAIDRLLGRIEQIALAMKEGKSADQAMSSLRPQVFFKEKPLFNQYLHRWSLPLLAQTKHQLMLLDVQVKRLHEVDSLLLKDGLLRLSARALKAAA